MGISNNLMPYAIKVATGELPILSIFGDDYDTCDGTGTGYSVLEIVNTFMKVNNISVPYKITDRGDGDVAVCYVDNKYAREKLNWVATHDLEDIVSSAYKYAVMHNKK